MTPAPRPVPAPPADPGLPAGFVARLSPRTRVCDDGRTLVGGTAGGVLHLRPAAREVLSDDRVRADSATGAALARRLLDSGFADPWWAPERVSAGSRDDRSDVTVVVPVRDRAEQLDALLAALPAHVPVVVVDDASVDPVPVAAVARRHGARLVAHPVNRGPAAARNTGLRAVATPYVAFVDSDVLPEPGWLGQLCRHFDDPRTAVVAPRVLGPPPAPGDGWLDRYEQARSSLDLGATPAVVRRHGTVAYLPSACLVGRTSALGDGFDEEMRVAEDVDLVWRLGEAGWTVRYDPAALVRHRHRTRWGPWLARKAFYGTGAADLAARHGDAAAPLVLAPWSVALTTAVLAQRRWSVPAAALVLAATTLGLARRLESSDHPVRAAAALTAEGAVATAHQTSGALTRHYWPLAAAAALRSPRARRAVLVAAVAEGLLDRRRSRPDLDPVRYVLAHRLDDLAYGTGLWVGAARRRSPPRCCRTGGAGGAARLTSAGQVVCRFGEHDGQRRTARPEE